jgi:hypothetical protein
VKPSPVQADTMFDILKRNGIVPDDPALKAVFIQTMIATGTYSIDSPATPGAVLITTPRWQITEPRRPEPPVQCPQDGHTILDVRKDAQYGWTYRVVNIELHMFENGTYQL